MRRALARDELKPSRPSILSSKAIPVVSLYLTVGQGRVGSRESQTLTLSMYANVDLRRQENAGPSPRDLPAET